MERLQKFLARAGIASRRAAEQIIVAGRVRVDGKIVSELGTQVDPRTSKVELDGLKLVAENFVYIVLHKPRGVVCTLSDPEGRPTIRELLREVGGRVVPVGRLDFHTSGALICTNDGDFAQALAHPTKDVPKVYAAKVKGIVDDAVLDRFRESIDIDGRPTRPAQVKLLRVEDDKTWLEVTLREGRNRQVRRLGDATGFPVMRLARLSHAGITSDGLRPGQWRPLSLEELVLLKRDYGVPKKVRTPEADPHGKKRGQARGAVVAHGARVGTGNKAIPAYLDRDAKGKGRNVRARPAGLERGPNTHGRSRASVDERGAAPEARGRAPRAFGSERGAAPETRGRAPRAFGSERGAAPEARGRAPRAFGSERGAAPEARGRAPRAFGSERGAAPEARGRGAAAPRFGAASGTRQRDERTFNGERGGKGVRASSERFPAERSGKGGRAPAERKPFAERSNKGRAARPNEFERAPTRGGKPSAKKPGDERASARRRGTSR